MSKGPAYKLTNQDGEIVASWSPVKVRVNRKSGEVKHAEVVLEKLRELQ